MKINIFSAFLGASFILALFLLNSFISPPRRTELTEEQEAVLNLLSVVELGGCGEASYTTLRVTGANLQVVNGTDSTNTTNGLGNLIVGYNGSCDGSHNVVIGEGHTYTSYSGLVSGNGNVVEGANDVVFGSSNSCVTDERSILCGNGNSINSPYSPHCVILGGEGNTVIGPAAIIIGGEGQDCNNSFGVVVGGQYNTNNGDHAVLVGGRGNTIGVNASWSVLDAGYIRSITGVDDWRAGSLFEDN
jgi:hypothetical protein